MTDYMPVLSSGFHDDPSQGACVMEYVSLLAGEPWSDTPACTHPVLARAAQVVNDNLTDADRHLLVPLIGRLFGTTGSGSDHERKVLSVRLAVWAARHVVDSARPEERDASVAAIAAAAGWCDGLVTADECASAAHAAYATYPYAVTHTAAAAAHAASAAYATYAYTVTDAAAHTATRAAHTAHTAHAMVGLLAGLLDEYDRLTGRTERRNVTDDEYAHMRQAVGT